MNICLTGGAGYIGSHTVTVLDKASYSITIFDNFSNDAIYLSTRDEIRCLFDEISSLKNIVTSDKNRATRMVSPIYASFIHIAPKKRNILAAGLFGGLFFGLLIALARQMITKFKSQAGRIL
jgi:UDP-glucose 4-epimerase